MQAVARRKKYTVICVDIRPQPEKKVGYTYLQLDLYKAPGIFDKLGPFDAIISALAHSMNTMIIDHAVKRGSAYFDLTESEAVAQYAQQAYQNATSACMPQCGIAPGLINIIAYDLLQKLNNPTDLEIRVGAIPQALTPNNQLQYAHTWSLAGLIREYQTDVEVVKNGKVQRRRALDDYETLSIGGQTYEAFNTAGGIGTLTQHLPKSIANCNYKTIRHVGHHHQQFLPKKQLQKSNLLQQLLLNATLHQK